MILSIITINLNNLSGLIATTQSVLPLIGNNVEWIIIDGESTDGSVEYIKGLQENCCRFLIEKDSGIYEAMNKGVSMSCGDYIVFMNSGDRFVDGIILDELLNSLQADIVYGDCLINTNQGFILEKQPSLLSFQSFYSGCICHQSTFVRRAIQEKYPFDENMKLASCRKFFLDSIVFGNVSVQYLGYPIAIYDTDGLSSIYKDRLLDEVDNFIGDYLPPMVINDMKRLRQYDRIANNSRIYPILENIHSFAGKKRVFERLTLLVSKLIFHR
jgi:glycosyltransferase involved in cell wall biosynthesis